MADRKKKDQIAIVVVIATSRHGAP